jgi:hypothetical protein
VAAAVIPIFLAQNAAAAKNCRAPSPSFFLHEYVKINKLRIKMKNLQCESRRKGL